MSTSSSDTEALIEAALSRRTNDVQPGDLRPANLEPARHRPLRRSRTLRRGLPAIGAACATFLVIGGIIGIAALMRESHRPDRSATAIPTISETAGPSPTGDASNEPTSTPTSAIPSRLCRAQDLELRPTRNPDYTGQQGYSGDGLWIVLVYRNVSATSCEMPPYPSATMLDSAGRPLDSIARWDGTGWVGTGRPAEPQSVTVAPGESASAQIIWGPIAYGPGERCSDNADIAVSLSDQGADGRRLSDFPELGFPLRMCGESVTPFVAGTTGTAGNP